MNRNSWLFSAALLVAGFAGELVAPGAAQAQAPFKKPQKPNFNFDTPLPNLNPMNGPQVQNPQLQNLQLQNPQLPFNPFSNPFAANGAPFQNNFPYNPALAGPGFNGFNNPFNTGFGFNAYNPMLDYLMYNNNVMSPFNNPYWYSSPVVSQYGYYGNPWGPYPFHPLYGYQFGPWMNNPYNQFGQYPPNPFLKQGPFNANGVGFGNPANLLK
jgi:hypothetical protein